MSPVRVTMSGGGGGAPSGAAGGDLSGTYPNPTVATSNAHAIVTTSDTGTVTSTMIADGTIVSADLSATAGITSGQLAGSIAPSKVTGTAVTQADTGTVTGTMIANATITGTQIASSIALAGTPTTTTPATGTNTTAIATAAMVNAAHSGAVEFAPGCYANVHPSVSASTGAQSNAGDGKWIRVFMAKTGTLHDVSFMIGVTGGNYNILILDTGQANATHTTRTCLAIKGSTATPTAGTWVTLDPSLSVNAGDTLEFMITFDGTTAKMSMAGNGGQTGIGTLPNSSWMPSSGAGTSSQKLGGTCLSANVPAAVNGTVTDANMTAAANLPLVIWRIA